MPDTRFHQYQRARHGDKKLQRPKRPCNCCGREFAPTLTRRLLCTRCYRRGEEVGFDRDNLHPSNW